MKSMNYSANVYFGFSFIWYYGKAYLKCTAG